MKRVVLEIPTRVQPKKRPRVVTDAYGKRHAFTPAATKAAEQEITLRWLSKHGRRYADYAGEVDFHLEYWLAPKRGAVPDGDNCLKLVSDSLNGIAFKDDRQIRDIHVRRRRHETEGYRITIDYLEL